MAPPHIKIESLQLFCRDALTKVGVSNEDALTTADVLVTAESWGVHTHGTKLLPGYVRRLKGGGCKPEGKPRIVRSGPAWAIVDGDASLGQVTSVFAMQTAIDKARTCGVAYVGVRNSTHFGAAGYYTAMAAGENLIGVAMANDIPSVAAAGSRTAVTGTNPISYAVPGGKHDPIMLDMAISTVAGGKVTAAVARGEPIDASWLVGPDGRPTTDASLYPHKASLAPVGAHKGYGLALLAESLAGLVTGAKLTHQIRSWIYDPVDEPTEHGHAFLAIDFGKMIPMEDFEERVDHLINEIHDAPPAEGVEQVYLPGELEATRRRKALEEGVPLPSDVTDALQGLAEDLGLTMPTE
jgi:ureidoglycolate dehydrogenase (NAD+)